MGGKVIGYSSKLGIIFSYHLIYIRQLDIRVMKGVVRSTKNKEDSELAQCINETIKQNRPNAVPAPVLNCPTPG